MGKQIVNKDYPNNLPFDRVDLILKGDNNLAGDIFMPGSLIYLDGNLLREGIDNHYSIDEGELELHIPHLRGKQLTVITFKPTK